MGDHGIVEGIGVFGDVEIFLDDTPHVGEEGPVGADAAAILIRLGDVVGANRKQPAITNLQFTMERNKPFRLPAVLGAETSAAKDEHHRMLSLEFGELPAVRGVVGKLVVGEDSTWNDVGSHLKSSKAGCTSRLRLNGLRRPRLRAVTPLKVIGHPRLTAPPVFADGTGA